MTIGINIKYRSLEAKKQVLAIPSSWPYLQAGCLDAVLARQSREVPLNGGKLKKVNYMLCWTLVL